MSSLLDIGPLTEEIEVHGVKLKIQGLTATHLFQLFADVPDMRQMLESGKVGSVQELMFSLAPDLIAKIITMATGDDGNPEAEAKARQLGANDQLAILTAVQRLSFKDGIAPFVDRITALMKPLGSGRSTPSLPSNSSKASSDSTTKSPAPFSAALQTDTPPSLRGVSRRAN